MTAAVTLLAAEHGDVVADVGFGGALSLSLLLDAVGPTGKVLGVEISPVAIERAKRGFSDALSAGRLRLHEGPITALPMADESIDRLMTVNTLYFVENLNAALAEMARVLGAEGRLVVGLGDPEAMAAMAVTAHGFDLRPIAAVIEAMDSVGLKFARHERVGEGDGAFHLLLAQRSNALTGA